MSPPPRRTPPDRSLVRASDIGLWVRCQRMWWLAVVQQAPHERPAALDDGNAMHAAHGVQVNRSRQLQRWGLRLALAGAGLALLAVALLWMMR